MKTIITLLILMIFFTNVTFSQSDKTFVKTIASVDSELTFDFPGDVVIKKWDKDYTRVTVNISSDNASPSMLKQLIDMGRYEFTNSYNSGKLVVSMSKLSKKIFVSGEEISENLKIEIYVPYNVEASEFGTKNDI